MVTITNVFTFYNNVDVHTVFQENKQEEKEEATKTNAENKSDKEKGDKGVSICI